ncbi:MAG TPA: Gfo/Idh/MocA family oxidoreductase [Blastocatellia bacterium]|jgi:predicted dehydrogenase|nr:Gfo/Idh/MocA family oxidoreductase [Blastocatellia bacterium]
MVKNRLTRRKFVANTAGVTLGAMIVPRSVLGGPGYIAPSDKLNIAVVGCGGQGATDAQELLTGGDNIVALCDIDFAFVDRNTARRGTTRDGQPSTEGAKLVEAYGKAKRHSDFRKMLEQQKDIDAVVVATPDHTHAVVAKAAMELGKHVYVEKPLTYSVQEARVLRDTAKKSKVVTQMGNHGHSSEEARLINEWIQAGIIGPVRDVQIWTNRPIWPQGVPRPAKAPQSSESMGSFGSDWSQRRVNRDTASAMAAGEIAVPANLEWDLYLGPAPEVAYHPIYHPFNWRGWLDWGTGALGDMAAHLMDHPYWALGLTYPTTIEATSTPWGSDSSGKPVSYPLATQVVYQFPARGSQPPVKMTWCDGGLMPGRPDVLPENVPLQRGGGVIITGEKGILMHETYGKVPRLYPESLMEAALKVEKRYERVETNERKDALHRVNWAKAAKGQAKAVCPFEYAATLTETMLLGIVALRTGQGRRIHYDGEAGKVTNIADANQYLHREYRKGWSL